MTPQLTLIPAQVDGGVESGEAEKVDDDEQEDKEEEEEEDENAVDNKDDAEVAGEKSLKFLVH